MHRTKLCQEMTPLPFHACWWGSEDTWHIQMKCPTFLQLTTFLFYSKSSLQLEHSSSNNSSSSTILDHRYCNFITPFQVSHKQQQQHFQFLHLNVGLIWPWPWSERWARKRRNEREKHGRRTAAAALENAGRCDQSDRLAVPLGDHCPLSDGPVFCACARHAD